jgi:hypothetical protein
VHLRLRIGEFPEPPINSVSIKDRPAISTCCQTVQMITNQVSNSLGGRIGFKLPSVRAPTAFKQSLVWMQNEHE